MADKDYQTRKAIRWFEDSWWKEAWGSDEWIPTKADSPAPLPEWWDGDSPVPPPDWLDAFVAFNSHTYSNGSSTETGCFGRICPWWRKGDPCIVGLLTIVPRRDNRVGVFAPSDVLDVTRGTRANGSSTSFAVAVNQDSALDTLSASFELGGACREGDWLPQGVGCDSEEKLEEARKPVYGDGVKCASWTEATRKSNWTVCNATYV